MNRAFTSAIAGSLVLLAAGASAQQSTATGAAGGAVTGAIVGGPVGAAVGGVAGALVGAAIEPPPPRVVTYVRARPIPAQPVIVEEKVVVGQPLPSAVSVVAVPDYPKYGYALVNNERVIVEPSSRKVIQVIE